LVLNESLLRVKGSLRRVFINFRGTFGKLSDNLSSGEGRAFPSVPSNELSLCHFFVWATKPRHNCTYLLTVSKYKSAVSCCDRSGSLDDHTTICLVFIYFLRCLTGAVHGQFREMKLTGINILVVECVLCYDIRDEFDYIISVSCRNSHILQ